MAEKRKKPTERQKNCSYSFPYMGENFNEVYCSKKVEDDIVAVSGEECESCIRFKNKHIQYPIEVNMSRSNHGIDTNQEHQFVLCHVQKNTKKRPILACI